MELGRRGHCWSCFSSGGVGEIRPGGGSRDRHCSGDMAASSVLPLENIAMGRVARTRQEGRLHIQSCDCLA